MPAVIVDPKGDLANLLLTFPDLKPEDFRPWIDEAEAPQAGVSPDEFAAQTAERWTKGLAEWGEDGARIGRLKAAADFAIYTPGSDAGLPVSVLGSLAPPPGQPDAETLRDAVSSTVSGILGLVGHRRRPDEEPRAHPALDDPGAAPGSRASRSTCRA